MKLKTSDLVDKVKQAIDDAVAEKSGMDVKKISTINGFTGRRVQHLLNNLCAIFSKDVRYFEVGTHQGAALFAAMSGNLGTYFACDNWSLYGTHMHLMDEYREHFAPKADNFHFFEQDCFEIDLDKLDGINVYFYDGDHSLEAQEKALTYFEKAFADNVIVVIDDYCRDIAEQVHEGTEKGLAKINYNVKHSVVFKEPKGQTGWWCGIRIMVLEKGNSNGD